MIIHLPRHRDIEIPSFRQTMEGEWRLEKRTVSGLTVADTGWFDNLITDWGLDRYTTLQHSSMTRYCHVGTGNTPPKNTDTQLQSRLGQTERSGGNSTSMSPSTPPYYSETQWTYPFTLGSVVGNLAEIGVGQNGPSGSLWSRALIVDQNGEPTTFPVLDDEQLIAYYRLRLYIPEDDVVGQIDIGPNTHDFTLRAANAISASAWSFPSVTGSAGPAGHIDFLRLRNGGFGSIETGPVANGASYTTDVVHDEYVLGTYVQDSTARFNTSQGNGTFDTLSWGFERAEPGGATTVAFQCLLNPPLVKTPDQIMSLRQRVSWGRHA